LIDLVFIKNGRIALLIDLRELCLKRCLGGCVTYADKVVLVDESSLRTKIQVRNEMAEIGLPQQWKQT